MLACLDADAGFHFSSELWLLARTSPRSFSMWSWIFFFLNQQWLSSQARNETPSLVALRVSRSLLCHILFSLGERTLACHSHKAAFCWRRRRTRNIAVTIFGKYNLPHSSKLPRNFSCKEHIPSWFSWDCIIKKMPQFFLKHLVFS